MRIQILTYNNGSSKPKYYHTIKRSALIYFSDFPRFRVAVILLIYNFAVNRLIRNDKVAGIRYLFHVHNISKKIYFGMQTAIIYNRISSNFSSTYIYIRISYIYTVLIRI